ncbi:MAG: TIGR03643 family protein [Cyanobacteria bacterium J06607_15]
MKLPELDVRTIDRVVEMAWEDRTPFAAIEMQFGLKEKEVIALMRKEMKRSSFKMWRKRVSGRKTKHLAQREFIEGRFRCKEQSTVNRRS